jgi:hypothetical protein
MTSRPTTRWQPPWALRPSRPSLGGMPVGSCRSERPPATQSATSPWNMERRRRRGDHRVALLGVDNRWRTAGVPAAGADHRRCCPPTGAQVAKWRPCSAWSLLPGRAVAPSLPWIRCAAPCYPACLQVARHRKYRSNEASSAGSVIGSAPVGTTPGTLGDCAAILDLLGPVGVAGVDPVAAAVRRPSGAAQATGSGASAWRPHGAGPCGGSGRAAERRLERNGALLASQQDKDKPCKTLVEPGQGRYISPGA